MQKVMPTIVWVYKDTKTAYGFSGSTHIFSFTHIKKPGNPEQVELTSYLPAMNMTRRFFSTEYGAKHEAAEYFRKWLHATRLAQTPHTPVSRTDKKEPEDNAGSEECC